MSTSNAKVNVNMNIIGLLGVAFVVLKLCGIITWSWWWVTCPFWGGLALMLLVLVVIAGAALLAAVVSRR